MVRDNQLRQIPTPGTRMVKFCGDTVRFRLDLEFAGSGSAWIRTNIGQSRIVRKEIIGQVDAGEPPLGRAWFDIPMRPIGEQASQVRLQKCL